MLLCAATMAMIWGDDQPSLDGDTTYLVDRLWIERMPQDDRDTIGKLAIVRSLDHGRFGVFELGSVWRHQSEIFLWSLDGNELSTEWPQDREHATIRVHTRECEGQAPAPFELCLDFFDGDDDEVTTLYSRHDWVIRPRTDGRDLIEEPIVREWIDAVRSTAIPMSTSGTDPLTPRDRLLPR